jgi:hypothetical protein
VTTICTTEWRWNHSSGRTLTPKTALAGDWDSTEMYSIAKSRILFATTL